MLQRWALVLFVLRNVNYLVKLIKKGEKAVWEVRSLRTHFREKGEFRSPTVEVAKWEQHTGRNTCNI